MKKITLVLGGIRSGKSCFGENKILYYSDNPVYIATSIPFDDEMKERVDIHKARRKDQFAETYEEPYIVIQILGWRTALTGDAKYGSRQISTRCFWWFE